MAELPTKLQDLINPQVMGDVINGKIPSRILVSPFARIDTTLQGVAGDHKTCAAFAYIGDAEDVAEGAQVGLTKLTASTTQFTIKKVMKSVGLTDEAVLSGLGNPVGQATSQLAKSVASKLDADCMDALQGAQKEYDGSAKQIGYTGIVDAIDLFEEEINSAKVMFIHPKQVSQLRKDPDFLSADKYDNKVMMTGEIGTIANTRIVASKKVPLDSTSAFYLCPIVKLEADAETEDTTEENPALTIFLKRDILVETDRIPRGATTEITTQKFYGVALTNQGKVVLAKFKK